MPSFGVKGDLIIFTGQAFLEHAASRPVPSSLPSSARETPCAKSGHGVSQASAACYCERAAHEFARRQILACALLQHVGDILDAGAR